MTKASIYELLDDVEGSGKGFYSRSGDMITVNMRSAHGNDPTGWINARALIDAVGVYGRDIQPDPMSGHIVVTIKLPKE